MLAPEGFSVKDCPAQILPLLIETVGVVFTTTVAVAETEQLFASLAMMVYAAVAKGVIE